MASASLIAFTWNGRDIKRRARGASARGLIGFGEQMAAVAKRIVHKESGDLGRSIHVARTRSLGMIVARPDTIHQGSGAVSVIDVGSWLDYACVEETGRGHFYLQPALEATRDKMIIVQKRAWKEAGL